MTWLDLTIIYIACGTPFAMYRIVLSEYAPPETAVRSVWAGVLWPFVGAKGVVKRLRYASRSLSRSKLETIRREIETLLAAEAPDLNVFEFRDVFDRFAGLTLIPRSMTHASAEILFQLAAGENSRTNEACLLRNQHAKIRRHAAAARSELLEYITRSSSPRALVLAAVLAQELSDAAFTMELSRLKVSSGSQARRTATQFSGSAS